MSSKEYYDIYGLRYYVKVSEPSISDNDKFHDVGITRVEVRDVKEYHEALIGRSGRYYRELANKVQDYVTKFRSFFGDMELPSEIPIYMEKDGLLVMISTKDAFDDLWANDVRVLDEKKLLMNTPGDFDEEVINQANEDARRNI